MARLQAVLYEKAVSPAFEIGWREA